MLLFLACLVSHCCRIHRFALVSCVSRVSLLSFVMLLFLACLVSHFCRTLCFTLVSCVSRVPLLSFVMLLFLACLVSHCYLSLCSCFLHVRECELYVHLWYTSVIYIRFLSIFSPILFPNRYVKTVVFLVILGVVLCHVGPVISRVHASKFLGITRNISLVTLSIPLTAPWGFCTAGLHFRNNLDYLQFWRTFLFYHVLDSSLSHNSLIIR